MLSASVDFICGKKIAELGRPKESRKRYLIVSIVVNLGLLAVFKYADFALLVVHDVARIFGSMGIPNALSSIFGIEYQYNAAIAEMYPTASLVLPIGISFYTFQSMSYTIDIYRRELVPERKFWRFFLFVSFFPQLVAGPIVRTKQFLYQLDRKRRFTKEALYEGLYLIILGFFLKLVIADNIAFTVDQAWHYTRAYVPSRNGLESLALTWFFSCQLFCDFLAYTSIARGVGYLLGFRLPINFNYPFLAGTFQEFWRRWHITLSTWFRDYLYVPLGGNRRGIRRQCLSLLLVMAIAGVWHGAAYTFVAWGVAHGIFLVVERLTGLYRIKEFPRLVQVGWYFVVQLCVLFAWVLFRSEGVDNAFIMIKGIVFNEYRMLDFSDVGMPWDKPLVLSMVVVLMHVRGYIAEHGFPIKSLEKALLSGVMLYFTLTLYSGASDFVYFQF